MVIRLTQLIRRACRTDCTDYTQGLGLRSLVVLAGFILMMNAAVAATLSASVSRQQIAENDNFKLQLRL